MRKKIKFSEHPVLRINHLKAQRSFWKKTQPPPICKFTLANHPKSFIFRPTEPRPSAFDGEFLLQIV
jgi:hypothetical protein